MDTTTQLETVNVMVREEHGLGNQQPSACDGEGSTIIPMEVDLKRDRSARYLISTKVCTVCKAELSVAHFYFNRQRDCYDGCCKGCRKEKSRLWQESHPDRRKHISQKANTAYFARSPERRREIGRKWYARNKEQQRERIRVNQTRFAEKRKEYSRWYAAMYPEKLRERASKRRAIKAKAIPGWANLDEIKKIHLLAREQGFEVDHIVPLNSRFVCGLHCESNLQLLPRIENIRKGNRWWPDMP